MNESILIIGSNTGIKESAFQSALEAETDKAIQRRLKMYRYKIALPP